ncbi:MBL fold metallo-hydrolase [Sporobolomyces koalae]|uniref:MBL fold metallo-hydrolase n=1 Tax=Sporobolomyces koalae TaxID=500713 RepID=UPI0031813A70
MTNAVTLPARASRCQEFHGYPSGSSTCQITSFSPAQIRIPEHMILHSETPAPKSKKNQHPIIVSLIHHIESDSYVLFDLGLGPNWQEYAPKDRLDEIVETYEPRGGESVDQVVQRLGVESTQIKAIVISHNHWDHCAHDFSRFSNAKIIGGPTTLSNIVALSSVSMETLELDWKDKHPILTFTDSYDVFEDGSCLVVPTPGHTPGHVALVVRTHATGEYVVLAGDCAHHPACLGNASITPKGEEPRTGAWYDDANQFHSMHEDYELAERSLERLKALERIDDRDKGQFMVVLAHDFNRWNAWQDKLMKEDGTVRLDGWKEKGMRI